MDLVILKEKKYSPPPPKKKSLRKLLIISYFGYKVNLNTHQLLNLDLCFAVFPSQELSSKSLLNMLLHNVFQDSGLKRMVVMEPYTKVPLRQRLEVSMGICSSIGIICIESFPFDKHKYFHGEHLDSEYLEFLELLAKPVENLPSAEIQLEKREAERSG